MQQQLNNIFFDGKEIIKNKSILFENGIIKTFKNIKNTLTDDIIVPGFVDLQIYGADGILFSANPSIKSIQQIESTLLKQGCTSFLICLATNTPAVFNQCIEVIKAYKSQARNCLGLHLEGPFINSLKRGAHVKNYIRKASLDEIKALLDFADGTIKMMTLATELQSDEVIQYLLDNKIILSLGHSDASFEEATQAYNQGVQTTTHLFNAMSGLNHRSPGIPAAVFNHQKALSSIIVDGMHVNYEVVKIAAKQMKERLFLITDAVTNCDVGPYQHHAIDGKYILPDGTLSGSALTMLEAIKKLIKFCDVELETALKMATLIPAKLINAESYIGQISIGAQANFVQLNSNLEIECIIFKGEKIKTT